MKIFVSYHRGDRGAVEALCGDLDKLGHDPWFDKVLTGGQAWWDEILEGIRSCDVFLYALTSDALDSTACKREFGYAKALNKPFLPVILSADVSTNLLPPSLSAIHHVNYRERSADAAFDLSKAIGSVQVGTPLPDPLPDPPAVPLSYLGEIVQRLADERTMSSDEQSALLVDLRRSMRRADQADDARALLVKFKERSDLLFKIAQEIEELLETSAPSPAPPRPSPPDRDPGASDDKRIDRKKGAMWGAVAGAAYGGIAALAIYVNDTRFESPIELLGMVLLSAALEGVAFLVVGALIAKDWRAWVTVAVAAVAVSAVWIGRWGTYQDVLMAAIVWGGGGVAILIAILWFSARAIALRSRRA